MRGVQLAVLSSTALWHGRPTSPTTIIHRPFPWRLLAATTSTTTTTGTDPLWWHPTMNNNTTTSSTTTISTTYTVCPHCDGDGKRWKTRRKRSRPSSGGDDEDKDNNDNNNLHNPQSTRNPPPPPPPPPPVGRRCSACEGRGLVKPLSTTMTWSAPPPPPPPPPLTIAIIGGGLAGLALATAAGRHRHLTCHVYERDAALDARHQGYGLTLQQAAAALRRLGLEDTTTSESSGTTGSTSSSSTAYPHAPPRLPGGLVSTKHVVHTTDGRVVGEWGWRKWGRAPGAKPPKRQNMHIARQALRYALYQAAVGRDTDTLAAVQTTSPDEHVTMHWQYQFLEYVLPPPDDDNAPMQVKFQVGDQIVTHEADLVVGADGIRSKVRQQLLGDNSRTPLRYLECLVILGICPLDRLTSTSSTRDHPLLDGETVFQTADGTTRIYMMPYSTTAYMWQLSFPVADETVAADLSAQGPAALLAEAQRRCHTWHTPVNEILAVTPVELVSGYPVYDRALLEPADLQVVDRVTLIGDACHPMSPFKVRS